MRKRLACLVLASLLLAPWLSAADGASAASFKDGEVVCFIGDSITHRAAYHSLIRLFYATRFPTRKITYYNCGIEGDRASAIMADPAYRLKVDILSHQPTVATIMLGMNDINRASYRQELGGEKIDAAKAKYLEVYRTAMIQLIETLQQHGARVILIEPSIYDDTAVLPTSTSALSVGANAALGRCAEMIEGWSRQYNTGLVDFYHEMNAINAPEQAKDAQFTIVGNDRIHPGPVGSFVMTYAFLKAQRLPRDVSRVVFDASSGRPAVQENAAVSDVHVGETVAFTCTERALPFVVPAECKPALALVPFESELNQEMLAVRGLAEGRYELKIDGAAVGSYTAEIFAHGINLAENEATPQYAQAAEAMRLNAERTRTEVLLRHVANQYYMLSKAKIDVSDPAAVRAATDKRVQALQAAGKPIDARLKAFVEYLEAPGRLEKHEAELAAKLTATCQPVAHHYVIARIAAN